MKTKMNSVVNPNRTWTHINDIVEQMFLNIINDKHSLAPHIIAEEDDNGNIQKNSYSFLFSFNHYDCFSDFQRELDERIKVITREYEPSFSKIDDKVYVIIHSINTTAVKARIIIDYDYKFVQELNFPYWYITTDPESTEEPIYKVYCLQRDTNQEGQELYGTQPWMLEFPTILNVPHSPGNHLRHMSMIISLDKVWYFPNKQLYLAQYRQGNNPKELLHFIAPGKPTEKMMNDPEYQNLIEEITSQAAAEEQIWIDSQPKYHYKPDFQPIFTPFKIAGI